MGGFGKFRGYLLGLLLGGFPKLRGWGGGGGTFLGVLIRRASYYLGVKIGIPHFRKSMYLLP